MPVWKTDVSYPPSAANYDTSTSSGLDSYDVKDTGYTGYGPSYSAHLDNKAADIECIPLADDTNHGVSERRSAKNQGKFVDRTGFVGWMERWTGLEESFLWLFFNGLVSFLWGIALAIFAAGLVPITFAVSQFARRHDDDWTNEIVALVGSFATMHVTYVLQAALELYSHIILAGEFTLKDLKWMQGVNEVTLFAEFPDRPGGPPRNPSPHGLAERVRGWWGSFYRWSDNRRLAWIVIYLGMALHTTSVVSILQPEEYWQHVIFNDPLPCGIAPDRVSFDTFLDTTTQAVLDKHSLDIGLQLGSYVDQVNGNTTTAVSGRIYRKDSFAYGAIGGLIEGLQNIPGTQYVAKCTTDASKANETWQSTFPSLSAPGVVNNTFVEVIPVPSNVRFVTSHPSLNFGSVSILRNAMYAVVDPLGNGAFMTVSESPASGVLAILTCGWKTYPKLLHVEMVNFTSLVLDHEPAEVYPYLTARSTLMTLQGMATAAQFGSTIHPDTLKYYRRTILSEGGPSYNLAVNATTEQIVETILADGGKASMTRFNFVNDKALASLIQQSGGLITSCESDNKTVAPHWRFGNNRRIGWIAVVVTIGMGILGIWTAIWMSKKQRLHGVSVLSTAGGFVLARGQDIADDQPLVIRDGKVVDVDRVDEKS